ncbi:MAG: biotin carboxylase N-terminal domain-containing protein [Pseudomonadota bacterium]
MSFATVLIANRGEIACRIARTARRLGYRVVMVYSDADRDALHVEHGDSAVHIGAAAPAASYLNIPALIEAARRSGADAVHPGYGFLAENAAFARACAEAGLVFIGPSAEAIEAMGNKRAARQRVAAAGVPCIPGYDAPAQDDRTLLAAAPAIGYPLMVKAAAGGGGRGLRRVEGPDALPAALASARAEAQAAFGSGELILERAIDHARHIELQVFGDTQGRILHLGERDCSVQRRNQKVIEESPSPAVDAQLRARMGEAAVAAARAVGYVGAGTVEMLLDPDGRFYFLEMNTRLQVEHPVTECVTGLDLVEWQLRVAAGEALPLRQEELVLRGHAIEVRLYAEDPDAGYAPQTGTVACWHAPPPVLARCDSGIDSRRRVGHDYDPMLAKIIAHGSDREEARRKLLRALEHTVLLGVRSNRAQLAVLLQDETFRRGAATTRWLDQRSAAPPADEKAAREALAIAAVLCSRAPGGSGWRSSGELAWPLRLKPLRSGDPAAVDCSLRQTAPGSFVVELAEGAGVSVDLLREEAPCYVLEVDGLRRRVYAAGSAEGVWQLQDGLHDWHFERPSASTALAARRAAGPVAPMSGRIAEIAVHAGSSVERGDLLMTLEAMKMYHEIRAGAAGRVAELLVSAGQQVEARQALLRLEETA